MTLRHALFVSGATQGVVSSQDARLALAGLLSGPGVLPGGGVVSGSTSGPNMKYTISAGVFVTARGAAAADGLYLFGNDGPYTVDSGAPAPASGTRYDLIWVRHKNAFASDGFADTNSDPDFGVTVGTAGSTPTKPYASVPAGALVLAEASVGTNIANASLAVITQVVAGTGTIAAPKTLWQYRRDAAQSIASNGSFGTVLLDTAEIDTMNVGVTTTGSFLGGFKCPVKGIYRCSGMVAFNSNATGRRGTLFTVNANASLSSKTLQAASSVGATVVPAAATLVTANAGDVIALQAFQDSGVTLALAVPYGATLTVELVQRLY